MYLMHETKDDSYRLSPDKDFSNKRYFYLSYNLSDWDDVMRMACRIMEQEELERLYKACEHVHETEAEEYVCEIDTYVFILSYCGYYKNIHVDEIRGI